MSKVALITGINGMDGSHLADFLLEKGYTVYGLERRSSGENRVNIAHIEDKIKFIIAVNIIKYWPCLKNPNVILNCQTAFCMPYIKKLMASKITTVSGNINLIPIHNAIKSLIKKMVAIEAIPYIQKLAKLII